MPFLAVHLWVLRKDRIIHGFGPGIIAKFAVFLISMMAFAEFSKEMFSETEQLALLAVSAWTLRNDRIIHGLSPASLPKFWNFSDFLRWHLPSFQRRCSPKMNDWPSWPFPLGYSGRITSSMGLTPAYLPNLTVLCFSMTAFAELSKEMFSKN